MWHKTCHYFVIDRLNRPIVTVIPLPYTEHEVICMDIIARIKTGFFEMKPYRLKAEDGSLLLIPIREDGEEVVVLAVSSPQL